MLLAGQHKSGRKLHEILNKSVDAAFVSDLIAGRASDDEGGDLFNSPINIDTIEGIIRSYRYLIDSPTALDPLQIARASFIETDSQRYRLLDKFWQLKGFIYTHLITLDVGLIADQ